MRPKIALLMQVKDEEKILARALRSAKPIIDYYVICVDSKTADNTKGVIKEELAGIPGEIIDVDWISFGANKTQLLNFARGKADYLLMLDADHELKIKSTFMILSAQQYLIEFEGNLSYRLPQLINGDIAWKYVGPTHEYLSREDDQTAGRMNLDNISIIDHSDGSNRGEKFKRDIELLTEALKTDPENPRYVYYLAQSYRDSGDPQKARELYLKRSTMTGWEEERWHAKYQAARMVDHLEVALPEYIGAYADRPSRIEPIYHLVKKLRVAEKYKPGYVLGKLGIAGKIPTDDILFVERDAYSWGLPFEFGICAFYAGHPDVFREHMISVSKNPEAPENYRQQAVENLKKANM